MCLASLSRLGSDSWQTSWSESGSSGVSIHAASSLASQRAALLYSFTHKMRALIDVLPQPERPMSRICMADKRMVSQMRGPKDACPPTSQPYSRGELTFFFMLGMVTRGACWAARLRQGRGFDVEGRLEAAGLLGPLFRTARCLYARKREDESEMLRHPSASIPNRHTLRSLLSQP